MAAAAANGTFFAKPRPTCTALFHLYYFAAGLVIDNMSAGPLHYKAESMWDLITVLTVAS